MVRFGRVWEQGNEPVVLSAERTSLWDFRLRTPGAPPPRLARRNAGKVRWNHQDSSDSTPASATRSFPHEPHKAEGAAVPLGTAAPSYSRPSTHQWFSRNSLQLSRAQNRSWN